MTGVPLSQSELFHLIARAQAAYTRCVDDERAQSWPDFFTESCLYVVTTADNYAAGFEAGLMYADSRGMLEDRISALNEANIYEQQSYRHLLGQPDIRNVSDDGIDVETSFMVVRIMRNGGTSVFASGRYIDRYVVEQGRALLAKRIVVCDSKTIDTLLALPL
ncbi:aromatic-ring-hydroxylating dioxygenase subunit beta [Salinisphaera orenii]|uniref:Terephthalate 1,2-dioxygenase n=1 Tax=Salinisphaera orenii YIM 95161 TaxID=1051139 RepID=A0A423PTT6_9GAMM|nr:aromatic-ring-hydroxylating dioxygenase subunit beta [Salinisphaera halophila]ROO28971.1 terephthalate 1,2-dioxygenase [Salinisphaera halophila YIM 95161]